MFSSLLTLALCFGLVYSAGQDYILADGNLRLNGGRTPMEGRLEVYYKGYWGTICDDYWEDWKEATVACRQMNFSNSVSYSGHQYHLDNNVPILLDDVRCVGDEERIADCSHREWTINDCTHLEDVNVSCRGHYDTVRLVGSLERHEGRVEVFNDGRWGTICDSLGWWDYNAADIVCRQLGYNSAMGVASPGFYEEYSDDIIMNFQFCNGNEYTLSECMYTNNTQGCIHAMDAAVICNTYPPPDVSYSTWSIIELVMIVTFIICTSFLIVVIFKMNVKASRRRRRRRRRRELSHISGSSGFENPNYPYATPDVSAYHPTGYPAMPPSYDDAHSEEAPLSNAETPSAINASNTNGQQRPNSVIYEEVSPVRYILGLSHSSSRDLTSAEEDDKEDENTGGNPNNAINCETTDIPPPYTPLQNLQ